MLLSSCDHFIKGKAHENRELTRHAHGNTTDTVGTEDLENKKSPGNFSFFDSNKANSKPDVIEERMKSYQEKCFLCMEDAEHCCESCSLPYCSQAHYNLHSASNAEIDSKVPEHRYCFPFRVLEREEVWISFIIANRMQIKIHSKLKMQFRDVNFNTYTRLAATLLQPEIFLR